MEFYFKPCYHYKNIPYIMRKKMREWFMNNLNAVVDIFNESIDEVNNEWNLTGKPAAFGDCLEDINPEYTDFIKSRIQPKIDVYNRNFIMFRYEIDEYGDIVATIPFIRNSRLWTTLKEIES